MVILLVAYFICLIIVIEVLHGLHVAIQILYISLSIGQSLDEMDSVVDWSAYNIKPETVAILYEEDYRSLSALKAITSEDLKFLRNKRSVKSGQISLLRTLVYDLKQASRGHSNNSIATIRQLRPLAENICPPDPIQSTQCSPPNLLAGLLSDLYSVQQSSPIQMSNAPNGTVSQQEHQASRDCATVTGQDQNATGSCQADLIESTVGDIGLEVNDGSDLTTQFDDFLLFDDAMDANHSSGMY